MKKSKDMDSPAALEAVGPRGVRETPAVVLRRGVAGNDASYEGPAISRDELEPWARHALAANDFDCVEHDEAAAFTRPTSYELHRIARVHRSFTIGEIIVELIRAIGVIASRALARYRQRRQARATLDALRELDDRALHDLGLDRSELGSVVAEVTGEAERTRVRAIAVAETPDRHAPSAVRPYRKAVPTTY